MLKLILLLSPLLWAAPSTTMPAAVLQSAENVLRLRTVDNTPDIWIDTSTASAVSSAADSYRLMGYGFQADQLAFCGHAGLKSCPVSSMEADGSAFLLSNDHQLISSNHVLHAMIRNFAKRPLPDSGKGLLAALQQQPLFLDLSAEKKNVHVSTLKDPSAVHLTYVNPRKEQLLSNKADLFSKNTAAQSNDLVVLSATVNNVLPLQLADSAALPGDAVWAVGYPGAQKIVGGHVISISTYQSEMLADFSAHDKAVAEHYLIYTDIACAEGDSGGPLLNASGRVVGVIAGRYDNESTNRHVCLGINLLQLADILVRGKGPL